MKKLQLILEIIAIPIALIVLMIVVKKPAPLGAIPDFAITAKDGIGDTITKGRVLEAVNVSANLAADAKVYIVTPKQASFQKVLTKAPYEVSYIATSTGVHEIEFWTIDPSRSTNVRDFIVSKKIFLTIE